MEKYKELTMEVVGSILLNKGVGLADFHGNGRIQLIPAFFQDVVPCSKKYFRMRINVCMSMIQPNRLTQFTTEKIHTRCKGLCFGYAYLLLLGGNGCYHSRDEGEQGFTFHCPKRYLPK